MPHSLRVRLKNLERKGELRSEDVDRIIRALDSYEKGNDLILIEIRKNNHDHPFICYLDKRRMLIYESGITVEYAKRLGWIWEEIND